MSCCYSRRFFSEMISIILICTAEVKILTMEDEVSSKKNPKETLLRMAFGLLKKKKYLGHLF